MNKRAFTVLVVDDEADIREVLEIALMDEGYTVLLAENGQQAMAVFDKKHPHIVVTDIKMPVMGGVELLKQIKQAWPDTEVIMITGHGDMALTISSLHFGAMDFITKPVNVDILTHSVARAVEKIIARQQLMDYTHRLERLVLEKSKLTGHLTSLGLMMGTISHDIKGGLTNLDGGLYLARSALKRGKTGEAEEGLELLEQAVDRIKKLILDVLLYSKERKLKIAPVSVSAFTEDISRSMAMKIGTRPIRFELHTSQAPETMDIDPESMMSALINILDNAIDACVDEKEKEGNLIELGIEEKNSRLSIWIRDNGCGMDMETREKIFDLFYSSKSTKGTGFGLFITHNIVAQHKGEIRVDSLPGRGTTFRIECPCLSPKGD
ncbi:MAG: response regulator [Desulfobacter sp.]|nr:MAG: response regulator [Desulfobacter sp.]